MPIVQIEPDKSHPLPYVVKDMESETFLEDMAVAGNTAELQYALGAPLDVSEETAEKEIALLKEAIDSKDSSALTNQNTAFAAAAFLRTYGQQLALDAAQARAAITNKLMELANCGDPRYELRALELLGKHSDIGIFTERSEVTINYKTPEDLEKAIRERVKRLLNADVIDITPSAGNLDEEFGVFKTLDILSEDTDSGLQEQINEEFGVFVPPTDEKP
jgi:hypothetical protein